MATAESRLAWGVLCRRWYEDPPQSQAKKALAYRVGDGGGIAIDFAFSSSRPLQREWTNALARQESGDGAAIEAVFWKETIDERRGPWADQHEVACRSPLLPVGFARLWSSLDEWILARAVGEGVEARCMRFPPGDPAAIKLAQEWARVVLDKLLKERPPLGSDDLKMSQVRQWAKEEVEATSARSGPPMAAPMQLEPHVSPHVGHLSLLTDADADRTYADWAKSGQEAAMVAEARRLIVRHLWLPNAFKRGGVEAPAPRPPKSGDCPDPLTPAGRGVLRSLALNLRQTAADVATALSLPRVPPPPPPLSSLPAPIVGQEGAIGACLYSSWTARYGILADFEELWTTRHAEWVHRLLFEILPENLRSRAKDLANRLSAYDRGSKRDEQVRKELHELFVPCDRKAASAFLATLLSDLRDNLLRSVVRAAANLERQWNEALHEDVGIAQWMSWCHDVEPLDSSLQREVRAWWDDSGNKRHASRGLLALSTVYRSIAHLLARFVYDLLKKKFRATAGIAGLSKMAQQYDDPSKELILTPELIQEAYVSLTSMRENAKHLGEEPGKDRTLREICLFVRNYFLGLGTLDEARRASLIDGIDMLWNETLAYDYARRSRTEQVSADRALWRVGLTPEEIARRPPHSFYTFPAPGDEPPPTEGQGAPSEESPVDLTAFRAEREQLYRQASQALPSVWNDAMLRFHEDPSLSAEELAEEAVRDLMGMDYEGPNLNAPPPPPPAQEPEPNENGEPMEEEEKI